MKLKLAFSIISISLLAIEAQAVSTAPFVIENRGAQVCRVKPGVAEVCLPNISTLGMPAEINVRENLRLASQFLELKSVSPDLPLPPSAAAVYGGAASLPIEVVRKTLSDFELILVRDIGVAPQAKQGADGSLILPFIASVRWKSGKNGMLNGTIYVEGYMKYAQPQPYEIEGFADSRTSQNVDILRALEGAAREVHFRAVGTNGKSVDDATVELLKSVILPAALGGTDIRAKLEATPR